MQHHFAINTIDGHETAANEVLTHSIICSNGHLFVNLHVIVLQKRLLNILSYLVLSISAELSLWKTHFSITSRIHLCPSPVSGSIPGDSVPQELSSVASVSILSDRSTIVVSASTKVILRFSKSET